MHPFLNFRSVLHGLHSAICSGLELVYLLTLMLYFFRLDRFRLSVHLRFPSHFISLFDFVVETPRNGLDAVVC